MGFQKGNTYGQGQKPGISTKAKEKVLGEWMKVFNKQGVSILKSLAKDQKAEFMRIGVALMPKEQKIDLSRQVYESWSDEDLARFAETGEGPEDSG